MSSLYDLTSQDIKDAIRLCHENVSRLLIDAETILPNDHGSISSGLYTYAVEELGKLLLLQKELLKTPDVNGKILVNPAIFGISRGGHTNIKFDEFQNKTSIPDECKKIRLVTGGVPTFQHVMIGKVPMPIQTGVIPVHNEVLMNFELRKKIFYVGRENGTWIRHQEVELSDLQQAITKLKTWISTNIVIP